MSIAKWLLAKKLAYNPPLPPVIKRVTGNPVEFSDGADAPLVKCVTEIQGSQDLHGYDKPWVGGAGKNKYGGDSSVTLSGVGRIIPNVYPITLPTGTYTASFEFSGTLAGQCQFVIYDSNQQGIEARTQNLVNGRNTLTLTIDEDGYYTTLYASNSNGGVYSNIQIESGSTATSYAPYSNICPITAYTEGEIIERGKNMLDKSTVVYSQYLNDSGVPIPILNAAYYAQYILITSGRYTISFIKENDNLPFYIRIHGYNSSKEWLSLVYKSSSTIVEGGFYSYSFTVPSGISFIRFSFGDDISNVQIERGTTYTPYEPYKRTNHTTTYPSAIYRGSEDVVNGEVESDVYVIDLADITEWNTVTYESHQIVRTRIDTINYSGSKTFICSHLSYATGANTYENGTFRNKVGNYYNFEVMVDGITTQADMNAWTAAQKTAGNPVQLTIDQQTPTTSSVTPTNLPIKSLSGYNHIESTTGEMVVDYITDEYQNFVDTVESALPNTRKGGVKAMDIFLSLEKKDDDKAEVEKSEEKR